MFLVIGYGNLLRGDDGVGQQIAQRLEVDVYPSTVTVLCCHQLTPELVEPVRQADLVIFVDAAIEGAAGDIQRMEIAPEIPSGAFTHHVSPAGLLAAAHELYAASPRGVLISITGEKFDYSDVLSPAVAAAVPDVLAQIHQMIAAYESAAASHLPQAHDHA